jgi:transcription elongation factor GreA
MKITKTAERFLLDNFNVVTKRAKRTTQAKAEAGIGQDGWHDEGFQHGQVEEAMLHKNVDQMKELLARAEVIEPEDQSEVVGLGSYVRLRYDEEEDSEFYRIDGYLTPSVNGAEFLSSEGPIGSRLLGLKAGSVVEVKIECGKVKVTIVEIFSPTYDPGN